VCARSLLKLPFHLRPSQQEVTGITFRVKRSIKFGKLFEAYSQKTGQEVKSFRFSYEGDELQAEQGIDDLGLGDDEVDTVQFDCKTMQTGGADSEDVKPDVKPQITISVKDGDGVVTQFKVKRSMVFSKLFQAYATKKGVDPATFKCVHAAQHIRPQAHRPLTQCRLPLPLTHFSATFPQRFTYEGDALKNDDTPEGMGMEDAVQIEVLQNQTGGALV
jgi:Ubiquitin-2 like Rad60 SUMO-like